MSTNSERIAANNLRLAALVEVAESLPDAAPATATVTITSTCEGIDGDMAKITINSAEPFAPDAANPDSTTTTWTAEVWEEPSCTIELPVGSTIACNVDDSKESNRCYVSVNGTEVLSEPGTYIYTVTKDVTVHLADAYSQGEYGMITITE